MKDKLMKKIQKAIVLYGEHPDPAKLTKALQKIADEQYEQDKKREAN
jgi:hypothetical protein